MGAFLKNILLGKQFIGIEFFSIANQEKMAFIQVERNKNGLVIARHNIFRDNEELLLEKSNLPCVLVINNAQVLQKEIQSSDSNDKKLLHKAFPNLQFDEFYYEIWRNGFISIVSICRKSYIAELLAIMKDSFKITSVSLGLSPIANMSTFSIPATITANTHTVYLDNAENMLQSGNIIPCVMDINGLQISNQQILGFAGTLKLLVPESTTGTVQDLNAGLLDTLNQNSFFEKTIKTTIALLLAVLLINFMFFSYYFDKSTETEAAVSLNKAGIENIIKLKERIINKENALKTFTSNGNSRSSLLLNNIVKNIPSSILLSEINYYPIEKKAKIGEPMIAQDKFITISGNTISNEGFTIWVEHLGRQPVINNVTIASFGKDSEGKTVFTINVTLK